MSRGPPTADRRAFLRGGGALALAALAGCSSGGADDSEPGLDVEPDYEGWFSNVSNYANTKDRRNQEAVTVQVGVQANNGYLGFGPPAVAVSPGTAVTWDWTGRGGAHNVVSETGLFDSGDPTRSSSASLAFVFDQPGVFRYVCEPHRSMGMKGAVFVALD